MKYIFALFVVLGLSACSQVKITASMCDEIASDPSRPPMPQECRDYSKKEADKAFDKVSDEKKVSDKDLEFNREK
ncbi:hypothetical protein FM071_00075 [Sulfurimonas paralvinellae]|uniref:Lipoprotein n=2 Tax=Sulfurimonas paralvinellae TaxID=317658 RepID=A0A7M1BB54_9BACT|nr:hypothetical protein FM071_00075 [Sulfurimonas paralvinellae]